MPSAPAARAFAYRLWPNALLLNRPGRALEEIAADVEAGRADVVTVARRDTLAATAVAAA